MESIATTCERIGKCFKMKRIEVFRHCGRKTYDSTEEENRCY